MRRWVILLVLAMIAGGWLLLRSILSSPDTTQSELPSEPSFLQVMRDAMTAMGYEGQRFMGEHWRAPSCDWHTYLVQPTIDDTGPFFFVRSLKTGERRFLSTAEFTQALKPYVAYDGSSLPGGVSGGGDVEYFLLGTDEKSGSLEFVGFDRAACGLKIAAVSHLNPPNQDVVKLSLQLLP